MLKRIWSKAIFKLSHFTLQFNNERFAVNFRETIDTKSFHCVLFKCTYFCVIFRHAKYSSFHWSFQNNNSIWSPLTLDTNINSNLDNHQWTTGAGPNCYQNYAGYYSNIDYLNTSLQPQQHHLQMANERSSSHEIEQFIDLPAETKWIKREDDTRFHYS